MIMGLIQHNNKIEDKSRGRTRYVTRAQTALIGFSRARRRGRAVLHWLLLALALPFQYLRTSYISLALINFLPLLLIVPTCNNGRRWRLRNRDALGQPTRRTERMGESLRSGKRGPESRTEWYQAGAGNRYECMIHLSLFHPVLRNKKYLWLIVPLD